MVYGIFLTMKMICVIVYDVKSHVNLSWPGLIAVVSYVFFRIIQIKFRKQEGVFFFLVL